MTGPLTSSKRMKQDVFDWNLYVYLSDHDLSPIAILKYGIKSLYFFDTKGKTIEVKECKCVLDFYVLETLQRQGVGVTLFNYFLKVTDLDLNIVDIVVINTLHSLFSL